MTRGIDKVGDLRLPTDSRKRYTTRSVADRYDERFRHETDILVGHTTDDDPHEIFVRGDADNQRRIRVPVNGDDFAANLTIKAVARAVDGDVHASITNYAHVQSVDGTVTFDIDPVNNEIRLGDPGLDIGLDIDSATGEVKIIAQNDEATAKAVDWTVQVDSIIVLTS